MTETENTNTTEKMANWILICLLRRSSISSEFATRPLSRPISPSLVKVVGNNQRVAPIIGSASCARARDLADRAAPLQLEFSQIAFPAGAGEKCIVDSTQRQIDHSRQVRSVATDPVADCGFGERESGKEIQGARQRRTRVGQRLQNRSEILEFLDEVLLGLVDGVGG